MKIGSLVTFRNAEIRKQFPNMLVVDIKLQLHQPHLSELGSEITVLTTGGIEFYWQSFLIEIDELQ